MYAVSDPLMLKWLKAQAQKKIHVSLYFDPSTGNIESAPFFEAIPFKAQGLMHRKILIIDEHLVFLGSANMTSSSLLLHDNLTAGIYSPELAQFLKDPLHHKPHIPRKKQPPTAKFIFQAGPQKAELFLLPDKSGEALNQLIHTIERASHTISISMFTLTHPSLTAALIKAKNRGVDVTLCIDFYAGRGASKKALSELKAAGIPILFSGGQQLLHYKWALVDHHTLIFGSTNWTQAAFAKNQDCLLFLEELSSFQQSYLNKLWKIILSDCRESP